MRKASREMVPLTWRFHHRPHLILTPPESVEVNGQSSKSRVKLAWTMPSRAWRRWNINHYFYSIFSSWMFNWYSGIFFFLCGQKEETRKNREHAPPSNKWAFRCLAAELAASPLTQSSPETTPKSLICYRQLPLSFAQLTHRHLSWQTCEAVLIMISSSFRIGLNLQNLKPLA